MSNILLYAHFTFYKTPSVENFHTLRLIIPELLDSVFPGKSKPTDYVAISAKSVSVRFVHLAESDLSRIKSCLTTDKIMEYLKKIFKYKSILDLGPLRMAVDPDIEDSLTLKVNISFGVNDESVFGDTPRTIGEPIILRGYNLNNLSEEELIWHKLTTNRVPRAIK